jgi:polar amino acid transport system substrate-binding protein
MKHLVKIAAAFTLGMACLSQSVHADTLSDIKTRKKVLIGVDMGAAPFGTIDAQMKPIGSEVEVAQTLAKDLGVELELVQVAGPNRMSYLLANKIDLIVAVLSITPERKKVVGFSKPYGVLEYVVTAPKSSNINKLEDLVGKKIAVVRGNIQDLKLTPIVPKGATVVRFEDVATANTALLTGQVDALCAPTAITNVLKNQYPDRQFDTRVNVGATAYAVGLRKGDSTMQTWVDSWVDQNRANGTFAAIHKKWMGSELPDMTQFDE